MAPARRTKSASTASSWLARRSLVYLAACSVWALALFPSVPAQADAGASKTFRVVVNARNPAGSAPREFVADAFLKRASRWTTGEPIRPVDLRPDSSTRHAFCARILKRPVAAVRRFWQQRIFSGRDIPPPELDSDESVLQYVGKYAGAIGYVSSSAQLGSGIKVISVPE
jgi:ABC-type phosphate transport system substrate-binding protein